ncbi:MAG TPA: tagatose 1,6-diphosphate aldolase [Candidatus Latescibacteria bacterium]|nr:tagatose 1,6-diphosphate aldolase [Candidatus Latescibacterota bacterium]
MEVSSGKRRNMQILADASGRFRMMAIDQRGSLKRMLAKVMDKPSDEVAYEDLAAVKKSVVKILSPYSSATLTDPVYGYPHCVQYIPRDVGLLLAYEETGYEKAGANGQERKSSLIAGWSAEKIKRAGANAVKLLIYYRPEASQETLEHQHGIIRQVGQECERYDLPFVLELVAYPLLEDELPEEKGAKATTDTPAFARRKPEIVVRTAEEFSKPEYRADVLKIEFPADLKYTQEYCDGVFDGKKREPLYDLNDVKRYCRRLNQACGLPWVILSGGVGIDEFVQNVKLAVEAGASGFLGGRAIWQGCAQFYPDVEAMEEWLATSGANNFKRLHEALSGATPWFDHPRFGGYPNVELADRGKDWYRKFSGFAA